LQNQSKYLQISTPGRICLFGEHQDYLNLPVIPCAISLRISLEGKRRTDSNVRLDLHDINSTDTFSLDGSLTYVAARDYFRSALNVMRREGYSFSKGFDCEVRGKIPINAGTSSSSALVVTWINFLARMSDQNVELQSDEIARLAHRAEVLEFNEPGGMMDQYSTAMGGALFIEFYPKLTVQRLPIKLSSFVLGDSGEPKDTKFILSHVKNQVVTISKRIALQHRKFSLQNVSSENLEWYLNNLDEEQANLIRGTIHNRDTTREALKLFLQPKFDERKFGDLLNYHQSILRDVLKISTPKINQLLDAALNEGAYGGKINGSGGGGCMFVYAPENIANIVEAINRAGGKAYIVHVDEGTKVETSETIG
jgi:galactokinase